MDPRFCEHLDEYGAQYARTEAAYRQCLDLVDRIRAGAGPDEPAEPLRQALAGWAAEDDALRGQLVALVEEGRVQVPLALAPGRGLRGGHPHGQIICAACHRALPRLDYPEWRFAHNGVVTYRGEEWSVDALQPA